MLPHRAGLSACSQEPSTFADGPNAIAMGRNPTVRRDGGTWIDRDIKRRRRIRLSCLPEVASGQAP